MCFEPQALSLSFLLTLAAGAEPSRIRAVYAADPSTQVLIAWSGKTQQAAQKSYLLYDTVDHGTDLERYRKRQNSTRELIFQGMNNVFVQLQQLQPDTEYYFVAVEAGVPSRRYSVRTLSDSPKKRISFVSGGDSRNNQKVRRRANLMVRKVNPDFVFFTGDMTGGDSAREVQEWLEDWQETISPEGRLVPLIVARGNHERSNDSIAKIFGTPSNGYFSVGMGGGLLRIFVLNTEISKGGLQAEWLKRELQNSSEHWKVAGYHRPMRPHSRSKGLGSSQYQHWAPLFWQHSVNMVFESDTHVAKATQALRPSASGPSGFVEDPQGTVYLGEGGWGAPLRKTDRSYPWSLGAARIHHFQWVWMDEAGAEVRTLHVDNSAEVEQLSDLTRFQVPQGAKLWKMGAHEVLRLVSSENSQHTRQEGQLPADPGKPIASRNEIVPSPASPF